MGRILFLTAVAYLAYRYIGRSNQKARELAAGEQEILPAAPSVTTPERLLTGGATEVLPPAKTSRRSRATVEETHIEL
jgi:hypothetical protein